MVPLPTPGELCPANIPPSLKDYFVNLQNIFFLKLLFPRIPDCTTFRKEKLETSTLVESVQAGYPASAQHSSQVLMCVCESYTGLGMGSCVCCARTQGRLISEKCL